MTGSKLVKKLEALSTEFNLNHCAIVDQIEDHNKLTDEQAVLATMRIKLRNCWNV